MSGYLFIFGNTPRFSQAELSVFFPNHQLVSPDVANVEGDMDAMEWMKRLGGTVKIAKVLAKLPVLDPKTIADQLQKISPGRLSFGLSSYSPDFSIQTIILQKVKEALGAKGISARFVAPKEGNTLSSVVMAKQGLVELVIAGKPGEWILGQTVAVQDFEEWNKRDYGRPAVDPKAGMLPPKVARMAVNLAGDPKALLDPFCGVGTILAEALLSGWQVVGSDQSKEAVEKTRRNLEFLQGSTLQPRKVLPCEIIVCDATHISEKIAQESVDVIVTEPYMGAAMSGNDKYQMTHDTLKNVIKGLEKLYIGCLKDWQKVLKPGGKVVIALPQYAVGGRTYFVKSVIDRCESLGYTVCLGPIDYSRPQAVVKRKFFVFQKIWHTSKQAE